MQKTSVLFFNVLVTVLICIILLSFPSLVCQLRFHNVDVRPGEFCSLLVSAGEVAAAPVSDDDHTTTTRHMIM